MKPPQNPTISSRLSCDEALTRLNAAQSKPMSRQPTMLAVIVAHGNADPMPFIASDIRYRAMPPKKLPAPTRRMSLKMPIHQITIDITRKCKGIDFSRNTIRICWCSEIYLSLIDGEQFDERHDEALCRIYGNLLFCTLLFWGCTNKIPHNDPEDDHADHSHGERCVRKQVTLREIYDAMKCSA